MADDETNTPATADVDGGGRSDAQGVIETNRALDGTDHRTSHTGVR